MRVWITAPSAAIGILALLLLMSANPSKGNPVSYISEETTTIASEETTDSQSFRISDLPFANNISKPCNQIVISINSERNLTKAQRQTYSQAFYRYLSTYGTLYKQDAQKVINESTIDCRLLNIPSLPDTPSLLELQEMDAEAALKKILSSLLLHSAHAYFVDHQYNASRTTCSQANADRERNLAKEAVILAKKQKHMACMTQRTIEELGYSPSDTNHLLDERFKNLSMCSRRALRNCQIMLSVIHLLDVTARYSKSVLESVRVN